MFRNFGKYFQIGFKFYQYSHAYSNIVVPIALAANYSSADEFSHNKHNIFMIIILIYMKYINFNNAPIL